VDTDVFVNAIIFPRSAPRQVVDDALDQGVLLPCEATMSELRDVLSRSKLDRYVSRSERRLVLAQIGSAAEFVPIPSFGSSANVATRRMIGFWKWR
jgi:uncharacterized protein